MAAAGVDLDITGSAPAAEWPAPPEVGHTFYSVYALPLSYLQLLWFMALVCLFPSDVCLPISLTAVSHSFPQTGNGLALQL